MTINNNGPNIRPIFSFFLLELIKSFLILLMLLLIAIFDFHLHRQWNERINVIKSLTIYYIFVIKSLAYIRGKITFNLVIKPETYKRGLEINGTPVDEAQKLFFQIPNTMLKCAGLIYTNEEEFDSCIDMLFKFMILARATKSIDGQFLMDWK